MTDDAPHQRLTELARKAWPDSEATVEVPDGPDDEDSCGACVLLFPKGDWEEWLSMPRHGRALDALDAALSVLAEEPPQWAVELAELWRSAHAESGNDELLACADELLAAAKGKP
jgi:hypothetical protein